MTCCICLNKLKKDIFTLSCSHKLHIKCFLSLVFVNDMNIFIDCPLCRKLNHKNLHHTAFHNLSTIIPSNRCTCITKGRKALRCKNKSKILNNGMCHIHNKISLPPNKYDLMCDYILWLFETHSSFRTKYYMIDISKNLCIKYDNIKNIQDILHYFYRFYYENNKGGMYAIHKMYEFYDLNLPSSNIRDMIDLSIKNNKLII